MPIGTNKLIIILVAITGFVLFTLSADRAVAPTSLVAETTATIADQQIDIAIADTEDERAQGLSGIEFLSDNQGMLFIFPQKDIRPSFWMKDMRFAIDIIWINDAEVVHIDEAVEPEPSISDEQLTLYTSPEPIDYVLEVNAGFSEKNGITAGTKVDLSKAL